MDHKFMCFSSSLFPFIGNFPASLFPWFSYENHDQITMFLWFSYRSLNLSRGATVSLRVPPLPSSSQTRLGVELLWMNIFLLWISRGHESWETYIMYTYVTLLVVSTPLKNISQLGRLFPIYGKIKNVPNHQPAMYSYYHICTHSYTHIWCA